MSLRPLDPAPDDHPPDDVTVVGGGRLERRGNGVDWRDPDGRLLVLGVIEDPDGIHDALRLLGIEPPPALSEWTFDRGYFATGEDDCTTVATVKDVE